MKLRLPSSTVAIITILSAISLFAADTSFDTPAANIIPWPNQINTADGNLNLTPSSKIIYSTSSLKPLASLLQQELYQITSLKLQTADSSPSKGDIILNIDTSLQGQTYTFTVDDSITISANSYTNTALATATLLQAINTQSNTISIPKLSIIDTPHSSFRALMIDTARQKHTIDTLKQCIILCRIYKVNYLQLHLTDDQSFTFESKAFPKLATPGRHFTQQQLKDLVTFADTRGVTIIPEFDAPGHTSSMRNAMPELFGNPDLSVINIGKEEVFDALETIVKEMCDIFHSSPYFHIGADEAYFGALAKDPIAQQAVKDKGYDNVHDLFLEFIVKMNQFVKNNGKQTLMWESFPGTGSSKVTIPNDITVMAWETLYQLPQSLLDNGYNIINVSWKPNYLTPGKRWNPEYIYNWNMFRWENHWTAAPSYTPIQLKPYPNNRIIGGMMCSWESSDEMEIPGTRLRLAPLCERIWSPHRKLPYQHFAHRFESTNQTLQKLIRPVDFQANGLTNPDYVGPFYNMENHFGSKLTLKLTPMVKNSKIYYTLDGTTPTSSSELYTSPITLDQTTIIKTQAYDTNDTKLGYIATRPYQFQPITGTVDGLLTNLPHDDAGLGTYRTKFGDKVTITLNAAPADGTIRYTTNNSRPTSSSPAYTEPITIKDSCVFHAQYFDKANNPKGPLWRRALEQIDAETNITTAKPVTASDSTPNCPPERAVDGIVDRNLHWDSAGAAPQWLKIDLQDSYKLNRIQVFTYWDDSRFYKYNVEVSLDGQTWSKVADFSSNTKTATKDGFMHTFDPIIARYIKVTMLYNSANPYQHIVEIRAFTE